MALFTNPLGRASTTYLGSMTGAALQASAYANGSVDLAALPLDACVFVEEYGAVMTPSYDKTYWRSASPIIIANYSSKATGDDVMYAASGTSASGAATSDSGTKALITHTGHGLTATNNGVSLYVSAGTNWVPGLYVFTYVDANSYKLDVTWNSHGAPTVRTVTGSMLQTTLRTETIPGWLMQKHSAIRISGLQWQMTSSANNRYLTINLDGSEIMQYTYPSQAGVNDMRVTRNRGVRNAQAGPWPTVLGVAANTLRTTSKDFAASDGTLTFVADLRVVDEFTRIAGYTVEIICP